MSFIETFQAQNIDEIDGVLYEDIKDILVSKEQLENILFTTKVVFIGNDGLMEFINKLMEYGYEDMALDYVENMYDKVVFDFSKFKSIYENRDK